MGSPLPQHTDIRDVLRHRLAEARQARLDAQARLLELQNAEIGYARALDAENRRFHSQSTDEDTPSPVDEVVADLYGDGLKAFLLNLLSDGKSWSLDRIKEKAAERNLTSALPKDVSLGRTLHGALLGLRQSNQVELIDRGIWRIGKQNAPTKGAFD